MTIDDLKKNNLILLECISGSRAYGLETEHSDTDIKGVFYLPKNHFFGLNYIPQISNESNDIVYYELGRFVELLLKNNPNMLELLATPETCILYKHPILETVEISDFISKLCKNTFAGYAASQIKKAVGLNKKIVNPIQKEKKWVLDFCYIITEGKSVTLTQWLELKGFEQTNCGLSKLNHSKDLYALYYDNTENCNYSGIVKDENSNDVCLSSISKESELEAYMTFNKDEYSKYCKEYIEYWNWVSKRNEARFKLNAEHGKQYDSKNMMHTIRLLQLAKQIFESGKINVLVNNREELLDIKNGVKAYSEIITYSNQLSKEIEQLALKSSLPDQPDEALINQKLINLRTLLYK